MKRNHIFIAIIIVLAASLSFWGCGGGPGLPGSSGFEDTGVTLQASLTPVYLDVEGAKEVDVIRDDCAQPGAPPDPEPFTNHDALLTTDITLININPKIPAGKIFVEYYTINYIVSTDSLGAPPIESVPPTPSTMVFTPPTFGQSAARYFNTVRLVDLPRKQKYLDDVLSGVYNYSVAYINKYSAVFTFYGQNEYGSHISFPVQIDFQMGWFDYCQ